MPRSGSSWLPRSPSLKMTSCLCVRPCERHPSHQGDWAEDSGGDRTRASLADGRQAHRSSGRKWIAPQLPVCCLTQNSPEQPRTGSSPGTAVRLAVAVMLRCAATGRTIHPGQGSRQVAGPRPAYELFRPSPRRHCQDMALTMICR